MFYELKISYFVKEFKKKLRDYYNILNISGKKIERYTGPKLKAVTKNAE